MTLMTPKPPSQLSPLDSPEDRILLVSAVSALVGLSHHLRMAWTLLAD